MSEIDKTYHQIHSSPVKPIPQIGGIYKSEKGNHYMMIKTHGEAKYNLVNLHNGTLYFNEIGERPFSIPDDFQKMSGNITITT